MQPAWHKAAACYELDPIADDNSLGASASPLSSLLPFLIAPPTLSIQRRRSRCCASKRCAHETQPLAHGPAPEEGLHDPVGDGARWEAPLDGPSSDILKGRALRADKLRARCQFSIPYPTTPAVMRIVFGAFPLSNSDPWTL